MPRGVLLVGGDGPRRRALREILQWSEVSAVEAAGASPALALLREASFDAILVVDESRRLAVQGLFSHIHRLSPEPALLVLPLPGSDAAALRGLAGPAARLLDPTAEPEDIARDLLAALAPKPPPLSAPRLAWARGSVIERSRALDVHQATRGAELAFWTAPGPAVAGDRDWAVELLRGAQLAAKLDHPSLPRVLDLGEPGGPFVATAYTQGATLARFLRRLTELDHALTPAGAAGLVLEILGGLEVIHDAKLVHAVLSPRSVWIGDDGSVLMLHAGIGRHVHATERAVRGALQPLAWEYEPPELLTDGVLDSRSDLFVAGILLWELLAGERLFARSEPTETLDAIRQAEIPPLPPEIPGALGVAVTRLLARDPDHRPRSASAARAEILAALRDPKPAPAGVWGRLFGKRRSLSAPVQRLAGRDARAERVELAALIRTSPAR